MLRSIRDMDGWPIHATDGRIGHLHTIYFDDHTWQLRYLVVETGSWFTLHRVLLSPVAITRVDDKSREIAVNLTRQQVEDSPDIDTEPPVSRQEEAVLHQHYSWPIYWAGGSMLGPSDVMVSQLEATNSTPTDSTDPDGKHDPHLRSVREITGYHLHPRDEDAIGHVVDFILDDDSWVVRYLVADTGHWLPGKKVLVVPGRIRGIEWAEGAVDIDTSLADLKTCPVYDSEIPITREYEQELHAHYGWKPYWDS